MPGCDSCCLPMFNKQKKTISVNPKANTNNLENNAAAESIQRMAISTDRTTVITDKTERNGQNTNAGTEVRLSNASISETIATKNANDIRVPDLPTRHLQLQSPPPTSRSVPSPVSLAKYSLNSAKVIPAELVLNPLDLSTASATHPATSPTTYTSSIFSDSLHHSSLSTPKTTLISNSPHASSRPLNSPRTKISIAHSGGNLSARKPLTILTVAQQSTQAKYQVT